jgi:LysM repeat protein
MIVRSPGAAATLLMALALAACSKGEPGPRPVSASVAEWSKGEVTAIAGLLDGGDTKTAKKRLKRALKADPMNAELLMLQQAVEGDAKEALGPRNFAHTVKSGETMGSIAQRYLGNALKAYQLARYNDLASPSAITAGQVLRIPGEQARGAEPRRPVERDAKPASKPRALAAKPTAPAPATKTAAVNPGAARQSRAAGLAALNQGQVTRAVGLLRRAAAQDPGNAAIKGDLARAERIAATVKSRR